VEPTVFTPRTQPSCRLATQDVQALLGSPDVALIDARPPAEYTGVEGMSPRPGHLPGALNIPAVLVTDSDGCFRPAAELSRLVARAGLKSPRRIVIYDGAGIGAAKVAFALSLIGYTNIAVYGPGWTEWSARPDLPVET
jgi:thiosulfate/3-mercaptopyruvate sulfurtransferase